MLMPLITNIQYFSTHDGPGIRTTVFFKGCPLRCLWCHNPETYTFSQEMMFLSSRCIRCGLCVPACLRQAIVLDGNGIHTDHALCNGCGACVTACPYEARKLAGTTYTPEELLALLMRDTAFYHQSGGGVTLSGGEVMAQPMEYVLLLVKALKQADIPVAIDTSGYAPYERFQSVLPWTDEFLYDMKAINAQLHKRVTGQDNELILDNLKRLGKDGARLRIRVPLIEDINDTHEEARAMAAFVKANVSPLSVHLLPYHRMGNEKAVSLGISGRGEHKAPGKQRLAGLMEIWHDAGFDVHIGG